MKIHGIELDEKYSPYTDVIDWYLSLPKTKKMEKINELSDMASDDLYNEEQNLPRENGDAIERRYVLLQYLKSRRSR